MDTAATLDQYTQDISNLPAELQHILAELGTNDMNLYEIKKKLTQKDATIHKFIKQHGSLTKNPKENQLYPKIKDDFKKLEQEQKEKCIVANTALFLTAKHLIKLEADIEKLKNEGLLVIEEEDFSFDSDILSSKNNSRLGSVGASLASTSFSNGSEVKKQVKRSNLQKSSTPSGATSRPVKRQKTDEVKTPEPSVGASTPTAAIKSQNSQAFVQDENIQALRSPKVEVIATGEDDALYCFCQRVSFGEMVGCDNKDCKYEWFHFDCVGLKDQPKGKWYCPDCTEKIKLQKEKKKRKA
ncbi:hypothetical protein WICMUC_001816 [Wickerhamomyces mucosus]|uniref:Chromatin modification-related protein n=1 Tax=Wickerhamomyces mucosus TaxID=1378264 RepID=A0A9P8PTD2_9ASCO|nr:hypothetical protein WICMUC_001816 [Wickerhamomyces mucosus]